MRRMGSAATAFATRAVLLADEGVRMASAGDSGALAACLGNSSLMVFHSTVLMQIGAPANPLHNVAFASSSQQSGSGLQLQGVDLIVVLKNTQVSVCMQIVVSCSELRAHVSVRH